MSLARIKPNILQPIHLRPCPSIQFRCLRTKPGRLPTLPPRQGAFGLPESFGERVKKRVENAKKRVKFLKKKDDPTKIPLVPKEPGQKIPVAPREPEKPESEMTEDEIGRRKQLQEQEKRIAQFEIERKQTREQIETNMQERASGRKIPEPKEQEKPDTKVYERDIIGRKFKKKKVEYKIDLYGPLVRRKSNRRWATRNHVRFTNRPENKLRMAQAAAEIIRDYHQHMNGEKLNDMLNGHNTLALQLPEGLVLQDVDPRHLALPFPTRAILPTMRLVFTEMKDQVRFALSDQQVNSISTGVDFIKHLLNPPRPITNPQTHPQLYTELVKIPFPANVVILPDKKLERRRQEKEEEARVRVIKLERQKERDALLRVEAKKAAEKAAKKAEEEKLKAEEEKKRLEEEEKEKAQLELTEEEEREKIEKLIAEEEKRKDKFYNFYGRVQ